MKSTYYFCKQLLIAAACSLLLFSCFIVSVFADTSGKCGTDVSWELSNGVLTISGNGAMTNYKDGSYSPWYEIKAEITKVVVTDGVTSIGDLAFYECSNLNSVVLSDSLERIGDFAFLDCENLKTVQVGPSIKKIGEAAFKMCKSLSSFEFVDGLTSIGYEAFFGCKSLVTVYLPSSVTTLGECAFTYCDRLREATIDATITELPEWTFYGCDNLENVSFSKSIVSIGELSFYDCNNLTNVFSASTTETASSMTEQIKNDIPSFEFVESTEKKASDVPVLNPVVDDSSSLVIDSIENDESSFEGVMNQDGDSYNVVIDSTVNDESMWDTIVEKSETYLELNESKDNDSSVEVNVTINKDLKVDKDVIREFAGKKVTLNLESKGIKVKIQCDNLDDKHRYGDLNLNYSLEKVSKYDDSMILALGDSDAFLLSFKGSADYPMTIQIPLGQEYGYGYATLYEKDGKEWKVVHSVRLDSKGTATLFLNGFDSLTKYMIGLNVEGVNITNAYVPSELSADYGILTDEHGNMYEVTGIQSKWGITLSQFSLIVFGVLGGVIVLVGLVMFIIFKMQQNKERVRREVMSEKKVKKTK